MAKTALGFWDYLYTLLVTDDHARWKAIAWTILICGTLGSIDLAITGSSVDSIDREITGASVDSAVVTMAFATLLSAVCWISWYCVLKPRPIAWSPLPVPVMQSRRTAFQAALSGILVILAVSVSKLQATMLNSELRDSLNAGNLQQAAKVLEKAKNAKTTLDRRLVNRLREWLISIPNSDFPNAWDAVMAYAKYGSFAIVDPPSIEGLGRLKDGALWALQVPKGKTGWGGRTIMVSDREASAPLFALLQPIDSDLNRNLKSGPAWVFINGASFLLDGHHFRGIICRNCTVSYSGGPAILERVYFHNCSFAVVPNERGFQFARAVLLQLAGAVTFTAD